MKRIGLAFVVSACILGAGPSRAQLVTYSPETDLLLTSQTATLLQQLGVSAETLATMAQLTSLAQQSLQTARMTSDVLRSAYDSVQSFQHIGDNEFDILDSAANLFFQAFPEAQAMARDAVAIKNNLTYVADGGSPGGYDPYAFLQLYSDLRNAGESAYGTLHTLDDVHYNLTDEHLSMVEYIDRIRADVLSMTQEANLPIEAHDMRSVAVLQARLTARQAAANTEAARMQAELVRQGKLEYAAKRSASVQAAASMIDQMKGFADVVGTENALDDPYGVVEMAPPTVERFVPEGFR